MEHYFKIGKLLWAFHLYVFFLITPRIFSLGKKQNNPKNSISDCTFSQNFGSRFLGTRSSKSIIEKVNDIKCWNKNLVKKSKVFQKRGPCGCFKCYDRHRF